VSKPQTGISDRSAHADSAGKTVAGCRTMRFSGCGFCMYGSATRILSVCSATSPLGAVNPILLFPIPQPNDPTGQNHPHSSLSFSSTYKVLLPQPLCFENDPFSWGVWGTPNIPTFKPANIPTRHGLSPFLSNSCALICAPQNHNPFIFKRFRTLCAKHPWWGGLSTFCFAQFAPSPDGSASCGGLVWR